MRRTPHGDKLRAVLDNPKCQADLALLHEAHQEYKNWLSRLDGLTSSGEQRVREATLLLNDYKDYLEVETIAARGSDFLKRQKGQLKLDNSILEEFLIHLVDSRYIDGLFEPGLEIGPQTAFMTFAFRPTSISSLSGKPLAVLKNKDQDFTIGKTIHYRLSPDSKFPEATTEQGALFLSVLSAEIKVNLDKTMFQECCGTASRLKQGCPSAKYFVLAEYLDMEPEDSRLTDIDNVFLLRHVKRLPSNKRANLAEVRQQHKDYPIDGAIINRFVQEIQSFLEATWHDPEAALARGSFA